MSYTSVFGGNTIYPSDVSYLAVALDADIELEWPLESSGTLPPAARILDVTPDASGWSIVLPDATLTGAGQTLLFNNLSGSRSFYIKDYAGNTLATVAHGEQWQVYLAATTTAAGTWRVFRYGASTATVQPSSLAGFGLTVTDSTLSQSLPVTTFSTTGLTVATSNRASAFVWTASGAGTLNLLTAASAGNNFFVFVRNEGGGDLTIEPAGSETINNSPNLALRPGDSCTIITDGAEWYTIGLGQQAVFAFDYTSISLTGGNYTLAGSELNRIAYKFVGTLGSDAYVIVPPTIQQYWINNATSGAFSLFVQTSGGTPVEVNQGAKGIYYCDGTNLVLASDPTTLTTPLVVADGGTGATTASGARLSLGITPFADAIVTATTGASVRTTISAAKSGANTDITSMGALTSIVGNLSLVGDVLVAGGGDLSISSASGGNVTTFYNDAQDLFISVNGSVRSYISSTGLFGIGTTAPKTRLQVTAGGFLNAPVLGSATGAPLYVTNADSAYGLLVGVNSADGHAWFQAQRTDGSALSGPITLNEAGGSVGIGTSSPARKLDVAGGGRFLQDTAATTGAVVIRQNSGDTVGGFIQWVNNANTVEKGWMVVDTSSNMIFAPNSAEAVRFTSAGNVGIGTSSPSAKLDVAGELYATGTLLVRGAGGEGGQISLNNAANSNAAYFFDVDSGGNGRLFTTTNNTNLQLGQLSGTGGLVAVFAGGSERMRVAANGNVGVGTNSPNYKLEVAGDVRLASGGDLRISAAASGNDMAMYNDAGDLYWNNGAALMYLSAAGALTVSGSVTASSFSGAGTGLTGTASGLSIGGNAATATNATNAANWGGGSLTSSVTWTNAANIIVPGESSFDLSAGGVWGVYDNPSGNYCIKAAAGAQVEIGQAGSRGLYVYGSITATGNVTAYSDARLKTDLQKIEGALDKIEKLTGYTFTRIDSGERQTGLVAQDVQAVLPEAVVEGEHLAVAYGNMLGLVVEAIKELRADLNDLRQQAVKVIKP